MPEQDIKENQGQNPTQDGGKPQEAQQPQTPTQTPSGQTEEPNANKGPEAGKERSFTQSQVNELVRKRIERERERIYRKYGFEKAEELDDLVGKGQSYNMMKERLEKIEREAIGYKNELALIRAGVNPSKFDDVKAIFKAKNQELTEEAIKKEMETRPEWRAAQPAPARKSTTIEIGSQPRTVSPDKEDELRKRASELFGTRY